MRNGVPGGVTKDSRLKDDQVVGDYSTGGIEVVLRSTGVNWKATEDKRIESRTVVGTCPRTPTLTLTRSVGAALSPSHPGKGLVEEDPRRDRTSHSVQEAEGDDPGEGQSLSLREDGTRPDEGG